MLPVRSSGSDTKVPSRVHRWNAFRFFAQRRDSGPEVRSLPLARVAARLLSLLGIVLGIAGLLVS